MVVVRPTQKVLGKIGQPPSTAAHASTTALGDWYVNLLFTRQARLVHAVSERSLLSVVLPARDMRSLVSRLRPAVGEVLAALGAPPEGVAAELQEMEEVALARTASRSVLGSMNDLAYQARVLLAMRPGISPLELALDLGRVPCSPLGFHYPCEVAVGLVSRSDTSRHAH